MIEVHLKLTKTLAVFGLPMMVFGLALTPTGSASADCAAISRDKVTATDASIQALVGCGDPSGALIVFAANTPLTMEVPAVGDTSTLNISYAPGSSGVDRVSVTQFSDGGVGFRVDDRGQVKIGGDASGRAQLEKRYAETRSGVGRTANQGFGAGIGSSFGSRAGMASVTKCTSGTYLTEGWWQVGQYEYNINTAGMPTGGTARIQAAANTISDAIDGCGLSGTTGIPDSYLGTTTYTTNVLASGGCNAQDTHSVQKFGVINSSSYAALTCTGTNGFGWVTHTDTAYNNSLSWYVGSSTTGCTGSKLDLQHIATHEIGHAFGLDDVTDLTQVMSAGNAYCGTSQRTIGSGDHAGLMAIY